MSNVNNVEQAIPHSSQKNLFLYKNCVFVTKMLRWIKAFIIIIIKKVELESKVLMFLEKW